MTQPEYVPIAPGDRVRGIERLPVPRSWTPDRPAETAGGFQPTGRRLGAVGPDQGFALKLARQFTDRLQLADGEHAEDAVAGCVGVATKRSAIFGRAPVVYDLDHAFSLWGFLGGAPDELIAFRKPLFAGASHHYWEQRDIVDLVPEATLRLSHTAVHERVPVWRSLFDEPTA